MLMPRTIMRISGWCCLIIAAGRRAVAGWRLQEVSPETWQHQRLRFMICCRSLSAQLAGWSGWPPSTRRNEDLPLVPEAAPTPPLEGGVLQLRQISSSLPLLAWAMSGGPMADSMVVARARALMITRIYYRAQLVWLGAWSAHCRTRATTRLRAAAS